MVKGNLNVMAVNLPFHERITRRYMCSYNSPESLMPPLELISCLGILREKLSGTYTCIDCIAESETMNSLLNRISSTKPNYLIFLTGLECFENDINSIKFLKSNIQDCTLIVFGHYPTCYPDETLINSNCDFVLMGEPELTLLSLISKIENGESYENLDGLVFKENGVIIKNGTKQRISNTDQLSIPAIDLLKNVSAYGEPMMRKPYGMIQSTRGCPYQCNFCVKSYGTKFTKIDAIKIVEEIKLWMTLHNIKSFRFIDDTFTVDRNRVMEICELLIKNEIKLEWSCLSRTDNLDFALIKKMKEAGCKRIYFGLESGSFEILEKIGKNIDLNFSLKTIKYCYDIGVETAAFFMSGYPFETDKDFEETIRFVKKSKLNFASLNPLVVYPGTAMFDKYRTEIEFNIYPYENKWKTPRINNNFSEKKRKFYKAFYLRLAFIWINKVLLIKYLISTAKFSLSIVRYLFIDNKFTISGIKPNGEK